jgi:hypothetical protein
MNFSNAATVADTRPLKLKDDEGNRLSVLLETGLFLYYATLMIAGFVACNIGSVTIMLRILLFGHARCDHCA